MNWNKAGGPPVQLNIGGQLVTKAAVIAREMNKFFIEKVKTIRNKHIFEMQGNYARKKLSLIT